MRGAIRLHVLHHAAQDPVHGAWMAAELERHGYRISPGTLYPTLHRMQDEGLLTSARLIVDGRTRRIYEITPAGRLALAEGVRTLRELAHELLRVPRNVLQQYEPARQDS
jgi:DNA-binding PadR family transcriptional regulator